MTIETDDLEQVRRDLAHIKRERLKEKIGDAAERWLSRVGFVTRTLVYLVVLALLWSWLAPTDDYSNRALGSLTVKEVGGYALFVVVVIFWFRLLFNYDEDFIEWEAGASSALGSLAWQC